MLLAAVLVFVTYKQLFGYGAWGTLWRVVLAFVCALTLMSMLLNVNYGVHLLREQQPEVAKGYFLNVPIALFFLLVILVFSYNISKPRHHSTASA
jgi:hypothetical protein